MNTEIMNTDTESIRKVRFICIVQRGDSKRFTEDKEKQKTLELKT